ncbi:MAG TPA: M23 family metallopeptidase [Thermoleophilaceae bacterium]|nr:M23 family metallopeptidase [Thermoleophilaceae bacterium]
MLTATTLVGAAVALLAAPTGEADPSGGATYVPQPRIETVKCVSGCASHGRVRTGGMLKLRGSELGATRQVVFLGGRGDADDVAAKTKPTSNNWLKVRVPYAAESGPVAAWVDDEVRSRPSNPISVVPAPPPVQTGQLKAATGPADKGAPSVETALSSGTAFVAGRGVKFTYRIAEAKPVKVRIALVRLSDGEVVKRWRHTGPTPDTAHSVHWKPDAGDGRYAFRLTAAGPTGAAVSNAPDDDQERDAFDVYGYAFPLHAHHEFGDGFGAGRGHEGQDVFARCGAPMYAARGGTVQAKKYHPSAGNYVLIDGDRTGRDFFYAHLREASPLDVGDRVYTGQKIGNVGDTGNAQGCHLHFELWSAPGWYEGGHAIDPAPYLRRWDRYS